MLDIITPAVSNLRICLYPNKIYLDAKDWLQAKILNFIRVLAGIYIENLALTIGCSTHKSQISELPSSLQFTGSTYFSTCRSVSGNVDRNGLQM